MRKNDLTDDMREYFNSLPEYVKQSIIETNADIKDLDDLKKVAKNLSNK